MAGFLAALSLLCPFWSPRPARAQKKKPLWEAGAGIAAVSVPDYPGSGQRETYVLPIPYLIYRGRFLRADRRGVRGVFVETPRAELNLSATVSPPVHSRSGARDGMPDLDPTFQIGPALRWSLLRRDQGELSLRLPVREVVGVDFPKTYHVGVVFNPSVLEALRNFPAGGWDANLSLGLLFADRSYDRYYYQVDPRFATPGRPAYRAHGGYGGLQLAASLSKRFPRFWFRGYVSVRNLSGAAFADSPLVERTTTFTVGIGVAWIFGQSHKMVTVDN